MNIDELMNLTSSLNDDERKELGKQLLRNLLTETANAGQQLPDGKTVEEFLEMLIAEPPIALTEADFEDLDD